ncbi:MAG: hypothetical protein JRN61_01465 [Nitrososphaerota archaeon]|nr:hypothetical protein [Nitrososphaerota archaeon]
MRIKLLVGLEGFEIKDEQIPETHIKIGEFSLRPTVKNELKYAHVTSDEYLPPLLSYTAETEYELNESDFVITVEEMYPELKNKKYVIKEDDDVVFIEYEESNKGAIMKDIYLGNNRFIDYEKIIIAIVKNKVRPLITALHLYQSGYVNPFPVVIKITRDDGIEMFPITLGIFVMKYITRAYAIARAKLDDFSKSIAKTIELLRDVKDELPFNYLNSGLMQSDLAASVLPFYDNKIALLDYIAGMESLFGIEFELQFRLSFYVAEALGKDYEERKKYKDSISELYGIRSKIAHGDDVGKTEEELEDLSKKAEDILRRLLNNYLQYLAKGRRKEDFKKDIEAKMLGKEAL